MRSVLQASVLIGVGCLQMVGDVFGMPGVKALGSISHASPAPKVFTAQSGFETYSSGFVLRGWNQGEEPLPVRLTPEVNKQVRGPYNRRNAYGAAISYGPVLASAEATRPMFESVFNYAFCHRAGVGGEVGLSGKRFYSVSVEPRRFAHPRVHSRLGGAHWPTRFMVDCHSGQVVSWGGDSA